MPEIRYVCLSDTHFGAENSVFTNLKTASSDTDPSEASPVLKQLCACLRELLPKVREKRDATLILNGDILELALTTDNEAYMAFGRFIELIMPPGDELFKRIVYIPGNHDHHLWELARETQYMTHISTIGTKEYLPKPWHATNMFVEDDPKPVVSYSLTNIVKRYSNLKSFQITTAYPNFALFKQESQKCVIFHHGHFVESLYQLMTTLRNLIFSDRQPPVHVWDIEVENFAWIDFFWSTMGRCGDVGEDVELIYEKMQDNAQFKKLLYNVADNLAKKYDLPGWGDKMEAQILKAIFSAIVDKACGTEKTRTDRLLSQDAEKGLWAYMNGPLKDQIFGERNQNMPRDVTFVFGHTHKAFEEDMNFSGYPQWVNVYNTGGWVVESVDPESLHGGAVVLVDEDLNVVSLRMYNEDSNMENYRVKAGVASHGGEAPNPLYTQIMSLLDPSRDVWKTFSNTVARAVRVREQNLRAEINQKT